MTAPSLSGMPKPDFLIIGAMKCATSSVATYLEAHPNIDMVSEREPRYFSNDANYAKGADWYSAFFADFSGDRLRGEGSNDYAAGGRFPDCAPRIAQDLPDVKLIYMVRHPVKRIISAWTQYRADSADFVPATLDEAIVARADYLIDQSLYWDNLQRYRTHFDDSQIFVGFMEDLSRDPLAFWEALCRFLGLAPAPQADLIHANPAQKKRLPSRTYSALNRNMAVRAGKTLLPTGVKRYMRKRLFTRSVEEALSDARFSSKVQTQLEAQLRPDALALLAHCNKPVDFWTFPTGPRGG